MPNDVDVLIRPMTEADLETVVKIEKDCFSDPWSLSSFAVFCHEDGVFRAFAAEEKGNVVGYICLLCVTPDWEIANVAVCEKARRRGIASALLERVDVRAKTEAAERLHLEVRASNAAALSLYEGHGFTRVGKRPRYYEAPVEDAVLMTKFL